jgi:hypothetical protein
MDRRNSTAYYISVKIIKIVLQNIKIDYHLLIKPKCPSPDKSDNPCGLGSAQQDCNGLLCQFGFQPCVQEIAPNNLPI